VAIHRVLIVGIRIAEQPAELAQVIRRRPDQAVEEVVADLVPEVSQQSPVRLVHLDAHLFAVHIVALGEVNGDEAVVVAGKDTLGRAGQQIECQPVLRVDMSGDDGQFQFVEFGDQPAFSPLRLGEGGQCGGLVISWPSPSQ
jgi:hypothetical protein